MPSIWERRSRLVEDWPELKQRVYQHDLYFAPLNGCYPFPVSVPTVVTIHDNQEQFFPELFDDGQIRKRRALQRGSALCSDAVITVSKFSAECLRIGYGLDARKIHTCHHFAHPLPVPQKPRLALPAAFLFYPANRWLHKNHTRLLEALALLRKNHGIDVPLVCTGARFEAGPDIATLANNLGVSDLVHDLGFVHEAEVAWLYRNARALVFPSLYEGFGYPLLEAMVSECPILASSVGALPEVAGPAAVYFDPENVVEMANAIRRVWLNQDLRKSLAERGRIRALKFSKEEFINNHLRGFAAAKEEYARPFVRARKKLEFSLRRKTWRLREILQGPRFERELCVPAPLTKED